MSEMHTIFTSEITIAVIMTHPWRGGFFRVACSICNQLTGLVISGRPLKVLLSVPHDYDFEHTYLSDLVKVINIDFACVNIEDRRYVPQMVSQSIHRLQFDIPLITPISANYGNEVLLVDQIDAFILLSPSFYQGAFISQKPYSVYVADYIQRYVPEIFEPDLSYDNPSWTADRNQRFTLRYARYVFATTDGTISDVKSYGGVEPSRLIKFPMFHAPLPLTLLQAATKTNVSIVDLLTGEECIYEARGFFLWVTNATAHKNQVRGLRALREYYSSGGNLDCLICGPLTDVLVPASSDYPPLQKIYEAYECLGEFKRRIKVTGYLDDVRYTNLLTLARFLWHNVIYDNGSFSILEAAQLGTNIVTSKYPQIVEMVDTFRLDCLYFNAFSILDAAAKLREAERQFSMKAERIYVNEISIKEDLFYIVQRMVSPDEQSIQ